MYYEVCRVAECVVTKEIALVAEENTKSKHHSLQVLIRHKPIVEEHPLDTNSTSSKIREGPSTSVVFRLASIV
jgi:hypothetical protein